MEMFPKDYKEFIDKYQTKEPKFGDYYIPALKVRQALEHYAKDTGDEGISLVKALNSNPYAVMAKAMEYIVEGAVKETMQCVFDSCNQVSMDCEKIVDRAFQKFEDDSNHLEEKELETWTLKHSSVV